MFLLMKADPIWVRFFYTQNRRKYSLKTKLFQVIFFLNLFLNFNFVYTQPLTPTDGQH
ncbi:hypothetical protein FUAX_20800 [Fulvitalea axinellae]|uniref:Uncharacterized protein n=1 Tax=Fulvitalea axinellae TaxID=1182444 RepID=A0AAU9CNN5_9BACT|nr:hypothetical protein FUAX_20800 [Fulvitalea axinellae]